MGRDNLFIDKQKGEEHPYWYHPDHLGSTSLVTGHQGLAYEHIEYLPYGESWIEKSYSNGNDLQGHGDIPYKFTSKEWDKETGLYSFPARYYEPKLSRWMSADPAGFELVNPMERDGKGELVVKKNHFLIESVNWYGYTSNNPVKYVDPTGRQTISTYEKASYQALFHTISAGAKHIAGSTQNFLSNVFSGNAKVNIGPSVSLFGMSVRGGVQFTDSGIQLTGDISTLSGVLSEAQNHAGLPVQISVDGVDISTPLVSVGIKSNGDGTATLDIGVGKEINDVAGVEINLAITASTEDGPGGTFGNEKNLSLNKDVRKAINRINYAGGHGR